MVPDRLYIGSQFRRKAGEREAIPSVGNTGAHYKSATSVGIGSITSRSKNEWTFWQRLAFELSGAGDPTQAIVPFCTPAQAQKLHAEGLIT